MPSRALKPYGETHVAEAPVGSFYLRAALRAFAETDEERALLLDQTGIDGAELPPATEEIRLWQLLRLADNLTRQHPRWGAQIGSPFCLSAHGPLVVASVSAPTLADSLQIIARFGNLRAPYFRLHQATRDELHVLTVEPLVELHSPKRRPLLEGLLVSVQGVIESTIQRPLEGGVFEIAGPKTPSASQCGSALHSPVRFDAEMSVVAVPSRWLGIPNPLANPRALGGALSELEAMERRFRQHSWIVREIKRVLDEGDVPPSLSSVAEDLRISRRTLERMLMRSNTSYRELVARSRRRRAQHWLRDGGSTIAEVAYRLGYSDPANFAKACRRWFGMSPSEYRKQHNQLT